MELESKHLCHHHSVKSQYVPSQSQQTPRQREESTFYLLETWNISVFKTQVDTEALDSFLMGLRLATSHLGRKHLRVMHKEDKRRLRNQRSVRREGVCTWIFSKALTCEAEVPQALVWYKNELVRKGGTTNYWSSHSVLYISRSLLLQDSAHVILSPPHA